MASSHSSLHKHLLLEPYVKPLIPKSEHDEYVSFLHRAFRLIVLARLSRERTPDP
jgi:hypothetical protein